MSLFLGIDCNNITKGHEIDRVEILNGVGRPDHKLVSFKVELRTEQMSEFNLKY